ncbi:MAG: NifU family protein [Eggerthellaceae bacterium]|nr:NifU family protein [Eggerthellaceae bacterium]
MARLERVLNLVRPSLQADGGDIELVTVTDDGIVQVRLTGACNGCALSSLTMANGVERIVKEHVPEVVRVIAIP